MAIELHNTLYAVGGRPADGLDDPAGLRAWLHELRRLLPVGAGSVDGRRVDEFHELRAAVRAALQATIDGRRVPRAAATTLNQLSGGSRAWVELSRKGDARTRTDAPSPTDAVLAAIAAETVAIVGSDGAPLLRRCEAPGCVLVFIKDHARRQWCSDSCGNRARQARHYARKHP